MPETPQDVEEKLAIERKHGVVPTLVKYGIRLAVLVGTGFLGCHQAIKAIICNNMRRHESNDSIQFIPRYTVL